MTEPLDKRYKRLKDHRLPEILLDISKSGRTGILYLKDWPVEKLIYVKSGKIIFASSNIEEDCLGIKLLTKGKISVVQYYESIKMLEKTGKRHGSILVKLGYLTKKELENAVREQVEEIVLGIFKWEDGYFFFEDGPFRIDERIKISADTATLIYRGIKNMDSFSQIRNALPLTTVLTPSLDSNKLLKKFRLDDSEKKIIKMVDGKRTVLGILTSLHGDDLKTLKVLYALSSLKAVVPLDYSDTFEGITGAVIPINGPEALYRKGTELFIKGEYKSSADVFREAANLRPDNASYYFYLAMSLINMHMLDEAEKALATAIKIEPFNDSYYTELGMVYVKKKTPEKAGKTLEFALRINPHNEKARQALADIRK